MFQKFFTNTLMSTYIKKLLNCTNIPLYNCVSDNDYVVKDITYIYNNNVITCTKSGLLSHSAEYKINSPYYAESDNYHYTYHSKYMYYDSDTHIHLGRYLRYIKSFEGINLMPYYNCFNHTILSDIHITNEGTIEQVLNDSYKVLAVPIRFNKQYTVAIDSALPVRCTAVIYTNSGYDKDHQISSSFVTYPQCKFRNPFLYAVNIEDQDNQFDLMNRESNLYLLVQVASANTSSLVVLEGDYINQDTRVTNLEFINKIENPYLHNVSLLSLNTKSFIAFSDRLVEYLLNNVITKSDTITDNIRRIQTRVSEFLSILYYVNIKVDPYDSSKGTLIISSRDGVYSPNTGIYTYNIANNNTVTIFKGVSIVKNICIKYKHNKFYIKLSDTYYMQEIGSTLTNCVVNLTRYNTENLQYNLSDHILGLWDNDLSYCINYITELANTKYTLPDCDGFINKDIEKILMEGI